MKINNMPPEASVYAYIVYRVVNGEKWYWGGYNDITRASEAAKEIGGLIWDWGRMNDKD